MGKFLCLYNIHGYLYTQVQYSFRSLGGGIGYIRCRTWWAPWKAAAHL